MEKTHDAWHENGEPQKVRSMGWKELYLKEDWWAIYLGLGIIIVAYLFFINGGSIKWIAISPAKWHNVDEAWSNFTGHIGQYFMQFVMWSLIFTVSLKALGFKLAEFLPSFLFVYVFSILIFTIGAWDQASHYNLEPPLLALALGLLISNFVGLPKWMDSGFRVEYYIKTGIVLLGRHAAVHADRLGRPRGGGAGDDRVRHHVLGHLFHRQAHGAGSTPGRHAGRGRSGLRRVRRDRDRRRRRRRRRSTRPIAITMVIIWAIVMIFVLPLVSRLLQLNTGVAGAWIGTSEFADAAGFAAAQAYGNLAGNVPGIVGTADDAVFGFTLMKVIGRDVWIGVWAFLFALIATTRWEVTVGTKPNAAEIWWRFPKFVLGFFVASVFITVIASGYSQADYNKVVKPELVIPILNLRTWAFIFCFFSIGLTTRFRELANAGAKPFLAFTSGVVVNVILGFRAVHDGVRRLLVQPSSLIHLYSGAYIEDVEWIIRPRTADVDCCFVSARTFATRPNTWKAPFRDCRR